MCMVAWIRSDQTTGASKVLFRDLESEETIDIAIIQSWER